MHWLSFIIGMTVGTIVGVIVSALCLIAAKSLPRNDDAYNPMIHKTTSKIRSPSRHI